MKKIMIQNKNAIISENLNYLLDYAKNQYNQSTGLRKNSADWKSYVHVKTGEYYSFIINGTLKFTTYSDISKESYNQLIKLVNFKNIENALLVLFMIETPEDQIIEFIKQFLLTSEAKIFCEDKSFLYYGAKYNLTQIQSLYGPGEHRPPNVRDPNREFLICKHLWLVLINLEKYIDEFAAGLIPYYKRLFGITSPEGFKKTQQMLSEKGIRKIISQALIDINNTKSNKVKNLYTQLTLNKLNDIMKPNSPEFYDTKTKTRTLKKETPEGKKTDTFKDKTKNRLIQIQELINKVKGNITKHL